MNCLPQLCWPLAGLLCLSLIGADRPNIVLILADDMGYADIGVHGCTDIPTPNIDRIAHEGVRFTNAYANASFCTPTRAALMSCRYQQRSGNDDLPQVTGPLPLPIKTLADRLSEAGYRTGMVGKWHLGEGEGYKPMERGFDEFYGFLGGGHMYLPNPKGYGGGYNAPIFRQTEPAPQPSYLTDAFGEEAAAFLKRHRDSSEPLFLYLAFNAVHTPMQATEDYLERFPKLKGNRRTYAAMLSAMDDAIGKVLRELDESGKAADTLVIVHNDNGGPTTRNAINGSRNTPLRGSKCETFEGGIRVPLVIRWPGQLQPGSSYHEPVITFDLSATALALAKADSKQIDGVDLLPFLTGKASGAPHETLFWRSRTRNNNYAVRQGDWKYVYSTEGTEQPGQRQTPARDYLFNLADDIGERSDLSQKHPEKLRQLKQLYGEWDAEVDADCRELGVKLPGVRQQRPAPKTAVSAFQASSEFRGLDTLVRVQARESGLGFDLASDGDGLAMRELAKPITGVATLGALIQPPKAFPSNGFIALGKRASVADSVKLGLLVGGNRISIFEGAYGSGEAVAAEVALEGGKVYEAVISIDIPKRLVTLAIAGKRVSYELGEEMDEIRHVGYYLVRTRAQFGPLSVVP
jgi:arylsulfatase A-like enzyme